MPKVSVIVPTYNYSRFICEAIDSVLSQTYKDFEIIVVDDGSTDNTKDVLKKYADSIRYIYQENRGIAAARNTGIKASKGKYLQFLDADDFLHKDKIKLQLEFSEDQDSIVSYCEIAQYYQDSQRIYTTYIGELQDIFPHLYNFWRSYPIPIHSLLVRKEIFEKFGLFDEELKACEDRYFFSKLAAAGVNFKYFPCIGGFRRIHRYNINKNRALIIENAIKYYKKLNRELQDSYFIEKFGYPAYQMMCANLTYFYLADIAAGRRNKELKSIRRLLRKEGIKFDVEPIPSGFKRFKLRILFLVSYLKRWRRRLFFL